MVGMPFAIALTVSLLDSSIRGKLLSTSTSALDKDRTLNPRATNRELKSHSDSNLPYESRMTDMSLSE